MKIVYKTTFWIWCAPWCHFGFLLNRKPYTANILAVLSTAFGSVTCATAVWLYSIQSMTACSQWLYWIWNTAKKSMCQNFLLLGLQWLDSTSYFQWPQCAIVSIGHLVILDSNRHRQMNENLMKHIVYCTAFNWNI